MAVTSYSIEELLQIGCYCKTRVPDLDLRAVLRDWLSSSTFQTERSRPNLYLLDYYVGSRTSPPIVAAFNRPLQGKQEMAYDISAVLGSPLATGHWAHEPNSELRLSRLKDNDQKCVDDTDVGEHKHSMFLEEDNFGVRIEGSTHQSPKHIGCDPKDGDLTKRSGEHKAFGIQDESVNNSNTPSISSGNEETKLLESAIREHDEYCMSNEPDKQPLKIGTASELVNGREHVTSSQHDKVIEPRCKTSVEHYDISALLSSPLATGNWGSSLNLESKPVKTAQMNEDPFATEKSRNIPHETANRSLDEPDSNIANRTTTLSTPHHDQNDGANNARFCNVEESGETKDISLDKPHDVFQVDSTISSPVPECPKYLQNSLIARGDNMGELTATLADNTDAGGNTSIKCDLDPAAQAFNPWPAHRGENGASNVNGTSVAQKRPPKHRKGLDSSMWSEPGKTGHSHENSHLLASANGPRRVVCLPPGFDPLRSDRISPVFPVQFREQMNRWPRDDQELIVFSELFTEMCRIRRP